MNEKRSRSRRPAHLLTAALAVLALELPALAQVPIAADQSRMISTNPAFGTEFGRRISLHAGRLVTGAPFDDTAASAAGAAYVYVRTPGGWTHEQTLLASGASTSAFFGRSVAVHGNRLAVGATGSGPGGRVSVFKHTSGGWVEEQTLVGSDTALNDDFGYTVAVGRSTIVVGARYANVPPGLDNGAAYVFEHDGNGWVETQKLLASDGDNGDQFSTAMALDGELLVVAAPVTGSITPELSEVYVFERGAQGWVEVDRLFPERFNTGFGSAVAVSGTRVVVGATGDDGALVNTGAAHVFERAGAAWIRKAILYAPDAGADDRFGASVAAHGDLIAVGGILHNHAATNTGGAWLFASGGSTWHAQLELVPVDAESGDELGASVALDADVMAAGSYRDDHSGLPQTGTVFALDLERVPFTPLCPGDGSGAACPCGNPGTPGTVTGCANSLGSGAALLASGSADALLDDLELHASGLPTLTVSLVIVGGSVPEGGLPMGDGLRCVGSGRTLLATLVSDSTGALDFLARSGGLWSPGDERHFQVVYRDLGGSPCGLELNSTNGVRVKFAP